MTIIKVDNLFRRIATDRETYILSCALESAKQRYNDAAWFYERFPSETSAHALGMHRGLIFHLLEQ